MPRHPHGCGAHTKTKNRPMASVVSGARTVTRGESSHRCRVRRMKANAALAPPKPRRRRAIGATAVVLYRAVRSRRRRALAIAWLLAGAVALTGPAAGAQSIDG